MLFYSVLGLGIVCTVFFLVKRGPEVTLQVAVLKSICSFLFIFTALIAYLSNGECYTKYAVLIIAGGVFGLLGDIWLDLKYVYPADSGNLLTAGFSSFLIGHLFFSSAIASKYCLEWYYYLIALGGGALIAFFTAFSESLLGVFYGKFKKITVIYMLVLGFTVTLSVTAMISSSFAVSSVIMCAGMVLFLASDAVLSGIYFGEGKCNKLGVVVNHSLYYAAQFLIASSLFFME